MMRQIKIGNQITVRDGSLEKYLQDINRYPLITTEQEVALTQRIHLGDQQALKQLVEANLRFVVSVAKQYQHQGEPLCDLINEGNQGLITAAQKFDETRGFKFISYAVWWIRQSILQSIAQNGRIVRLPQNQMGQVARINRAIDEFEQEHNRRPNNDEIAQMLDITEEKVSNALRVDGHGVSIDAPIGNDPDDVARVDRLTDTSAAATDDQLNRDDLRIEVDRVLNILGERERNIVAMSFGIGCHEMTLEEIGLRLNLTRERVRQIKDKAIRTLRGCPYSQRLVSYCG